MKSLRLILFLGLAVGACASPQPAETPVPTPASATEAEAAPPAETAPAPEAAPAAEPSAPSEPAAPAVPTAPARWWMADPDASSPGAGVDRAYRELLAGREPERTVVVGVIDSGVDIDHEDLDDVLWVNEDEVPGNGVDDDGNGYVDDVHGWNFIGGSDGRHVDVDTYEIARLQARCLAGDPPTPEPAAGVGTCEEIAASLREDRESAREQLVQIRMISMAVEDFGRLLREELGTDSLTVEAVDGLVSMRNDVRRARQAWLQMTAAGITPEMVHEEKQRLQDRLDYGLNPEFDPRPIVGDDYADGDQRVYGNPDVEGPRAGHGTGVAGIIAAERENEIGEDGIAPARIMALRVVPDGDERDKDVANAIRYAVDNGAHIINMSFGKGHSPEKPLVDAAVRYAAERGVLLVHAAGNAGADLAEEPSYPTPVFADGGRAETWLSVGASNWQGPHQLAAPFSNWGDEEVDVFAPGVDIRTTDVDGGFQVNSGTSFAAPVVSGLAALIMAYYPDLDARAVRSIILETARPFPEAMVVRPGSPGQGEATLVPFAELSATGGIVDAYAALKRADAVAGASGQPASR